jgi:hypothetical protein
MEEGSAPCSWFKSKKNEIIILTATHIVTYLNKHYAIDNWWPMNWMAVIDSRGTETNVGGLKFRRFQVRISARTSPIIK